MNNSLGIVARFPDEHTCHQNQGNTVLSFWLREATTGFALKDMIYSEKDSDSVPHNNLANDIVMKLCSVYLVQVKTYMLTGIFPLMAWCATFCSKI